MGNSILKNKVTILDISNWALVVLHEKLNEYIEEGKVVSKINKKVIESIDQDNFGLGCVNLELTDFFDNHPEDLNEFIKLIINATQDLQKNDTLNASHYDRLQEFIKSLNNYLYSLKNK